MNNKEFIHIHHTFIESNLSTFIKLYDLSLTRFLIAYKSRDFDSINYTTEPELIDEVEKEFLQTTLKLLKDRYERFSRMRKTIYYNFLKEKEISEEEFNQQWDSGISEEFSVYEYDQFSEETWNEITSFKMKIQFLLIKANKIGCVIELQKNFAIEERETDDHGLYIDASGQEKLIYLKETGIIDFLKEKYPTVSEFKLSQLLNTITGQENLQPGLNAMEGTQKFDAKNSPYKSDKKVQKIQDQLIQWGFSKPTPKN